MQLLLDNLRYGIARIWHRMRPSSIKNTALGLDSVIESGSQVVDSEFGRHTFCGSDCTILNAQIGSFCSIASGVCIGGAGHPVHFVSTSPVFLAHRDSVRAKFSKHEFNQLPRTTIGNDVWIGFGATVKAGVSIGTGSVIGMGAVVTKDVPPYSIVAGNPAREIRKRFDRQVIEGLLASNWWDFDDERLKRVAVDFQSPENFLRNEGLL